MIVRLYCLLFKDITEKLGGGVANADMKNKVKHHMSVKGDRWRRLMMLLADTARIGRVSQLWSGVFLIFSCFDGREFYFCTCR